ncbi:uncharacterized protein J4E79_001340 [Alternaria viburni]|uniref:uncharacterized protein n=1 Tax=Alternaria viburni TaxID=566460 RepID=UPI0020C240A6|nr:uncharacterized protein J4E79_001340 [Alternaria viburni]KAI4669297.1 hypothetical protein J4E79_001340 [Alternaria viburni]
MGKKCERYDKQQLLDMLQEQCPDAMAKLPSADTFIFQNLDDGPGKAMLRIGTCTKGKRSPTTHELYVQCGGKAKPELWFDIQNDYQSFNGDGFFKNMDGWYIYSDILKAAIAFVFVYCGHKEKFCDFGFGNGFKLLVKVLNYLLSDVEGGAASSNNTADAGTDTAEASDADANMVKIPGDDRSEEKLPEEYPQKSLDNVLSEKPRKRSLSVESDEPVVQKKLRVE